MKENRISYIDGIRGLAAMMVVIHHYMISFYPGFSIYNADAQYIHTSNNIEQAIGFNPISVLWNSKMAVSLFFVISGYALSYKYIITKNQEYLQSSVIRRYFRLLLPVLFSVFVACILIKARLFSNVFVAENYTKSSYWLGSWWRGDPSMPGALKEGFFSAFIMGSGNTYNPVLWTMVIEFLGSMLVFATLAVFGNFAKRFLIYAILIALIHSNFFPDFIVGLALCDYYHSQERKMSPKIIVFLIFILSLYIGGYQSLPGPNVWSILNPIEAAGSPFPFIIGASLFVFTVINSEWLKRFFSSRILQFLGKISFSLYLIHLLILGSLACSLFGYFYSGLNLSYGMSFLFMFLISVIVTFIVSFLMYKYVDERGIKLSKWVYNKFFAPEKIGEGE